MTKKIAFLTATEGIERAELVDPWETLQGAGHSSELLSTESGEVQTFEHLDKADTRLVDRVAEASADDYDALG